MNRYILALTILLTLCFHTSPANATDYGVCSGDRDQFCQGQVWFWEGGDANNLGACLWKHSTEISTACLQDITVHKQYGGCTEARNKYCAGQGWSTENPPTNTLVSCIYKNYDKVGVACQQMVALNTYSRICSAFARENGKMVSIGNKRVYGDTSAAAASKCHEFALKQDQTYHNGYLSKGKWDVACQLRKPNQGPIKVEVLDQFQGSNDAEAFNRVTEYDFSCDSMGNNKTHSVDKTLTTVQVSKDTPKNPCVAPYVFNSKTGMCEVNTPAQAQPASSADDSDGDAAKAK